MPQRALGRVHRSVFAIIAIASIGIAIGLAFPTGSGASNSALTPDAKPVPPQAHTPTQRGRGIANQLYRLTPATCDFGIVGHLQKKSLDFTIENTSAGPLVLNTPKPSCGCIHVDLDLRPIPPGESRTGRVRVDFGRMVGQFHKNVQFSARSAGRAITMPVVAMFHPGLRVEPRFPSKPYTVVGGVHPASSQRFTLTRTAKDGSKLSVTNLHFERVRGAQYNAKVLPIDDEHCTIQVDISPGEKEGQIRGDLHANINGLPFVWPLYGYQFQHIVTMPEHVLFSRIEQPESARQTIEVYGSDATPFKILGVDYEAGSRPSAVAVGFEVKPRPAGGYLVTVFPVAPFPETTGSLSGTVVVHTDHPKKPELRLRLIGMIVGSKSKK